MTMPIYKVKTLSKMNKQEQDEGTWLFWGETCTIYARKSKFDLIETKKKCHYQGKLAE